MTRSRVTAAAVIAGVLLSGCAASDLASYALSVGEHAAVIARGVEPGVVTRVDEVLDEVVPEVDVVTSGPTTRVVAVIGTQRPELAGGRADLAAAAITVPGQVGGYLAIDAAAAEHADQQVLRVLLAHEVTHLRVPTATGVPLWLTEGAADLIGYYVAELPIAQVLGADPMPTRLPSDVDLTGSNASAAYLRAWATTSYLASRIGLAGVVALIREAAVADDPTATIKTALAGLELSMDSLPAAVDAYLAAVLD